MKDHERALIALLPRLRRFALAITRSATESDDLVQSAVERALGSWQRRPPDMQIDSWMFKIVQNLWIDERRRHRNRYAAAAPDETMCGEDGRTVTAGRLDLAEVCAAMAGLPEQQQAVLGLIVIDGMSYAQAADVLSIPVGTVMSRLARARAALARRYLGETDQGAPLALFDNRATTRIEETSK